MRIDLPLCNLKTCRYSSDCNCIDKNRYNSCEYAYAESENYKLKDENEQLKKDNEDLRMHIETMRKIRPMIL